jgi:putative heme-binding domain-containing protein
VLRLSAARTLGAVKLSDQQRLVLADALATAGPLELPELLTALVGSSSPELGQRAAAALVANPAADGLPEELLERLWKSYPAEVRAQAEPLLARRAALGEDRQAHLAALEPLLIGGDVGRGQGVFFAARAACSTCHTVGDRGGAVGPDLSRIATIRSGRDLLEALVYPSASLVRGYEPVVAALDDGRALQGLLLHDTPDAVVLRLADGSDVRLARSGLEELRSTSTSLMPQGLETTLARAELADLLAYLQSLR